MVEASTHRHCYFTLQEVLRWVMTRAQTHSVAARSSGLHTTQEKAKKLEVTCLCCPLHVPTISCHI